LPLIFGIFTFVITFYQYDIATKQRTEDQNIARLVHELETTLANEQHQNQIVDAYIKEMGELTKKNNGALTSN